jgi:hypothetical protein
MFNNQQTKDMQLSENEAAYYTKWYKENKTVRDYVREVTKEAFGFAVQINGLDDIAFYLGLLNDEGINDIKNLIKKESIKRVRECSGLIAIS